jgi:hypothetical protein
MDREKAAELVGRWVLCGLKLYGGAADQWFKSNEFSLQEALRGSFALEADDEEIPLWADGLLEETERWINTVPFREITEDDLDRARRVGRMNGLEEASRLLMDQAAGCFRSRKDDEAFFLRDKAKEIAALAEVVK